jgi:hypothetical protein
MFGAGRSRSVVVDATTAGSSLVPPELVTCSNCGGGPMGRYCAACGQRRITESDLTARGFAHEVLGNIISIDGRFWGTLWTLVRHPGQLARDYFDGRGARYMRPLNLFLLLNLAFFVVQPHTGLLQWHLRGYVRGQAVAQRLVDGKRQERAVEAARRTGPAAVPRLEPMEQFEAEFESKIQELKKSMLLVAIPLFALALSAAYGRRHRLAEHLIFSTHFFAFAVFALLAVIPVTFMTLVGWLYLVRAPAGVYRVLSGEGALTVVLFVVLGGYLYVGVRRMYGDTRRAAAIRAVALFGAYQALVVLFSIMMFRVTLWAM